MLKGTTWLVTPTTILPCPFCGEPPTWIGVMDSTSEGVGCGRCHVRLVEEMPEEYPKGIKTIPQLRKWMLLKAIERWQRRTT
jgi:hypothetical protein